ncbi:MAG: hybrid sensor histidine kinase/response regulator, partial [Elusimicrobia bacterium]|nr:hybrid sensor histidine kinase/response regulator [Elusimicrobiota bacterium]
MEEAAGKILIVTTDRALATEASSLFSPKGAETLVAANLAGAQSRISSEKILGVIVDAARIGAAERNGLSQIQTQKNLPLFILETLGTLSPLETSSLRRLPWPLPQGFSDLVRTAAKPVIFLADQTMFASRALQILLQQAGLQPLILDSTVGLGETMTATPTRTKSFWEKLTGSGGAEESEERPRVAVAQFAGDLNAAAAFDARLRQALPNAACYHVSGVEAMRAAAVALQERRPAILLREDIRRIPALLFGGETSARPRPERGARILLVDNYKPSLDSLAQALAAAKYEVAATMDGNQALAAAQKPGSFHLAVIGAALAYTQRTGADLALALRERDPDLRIIFMVDQYPLQSALKGMSQVVELGLDDALLKPVESSRLIFSVQRALERRFLIMENARLLKEVQESNRQLAQINAFQKKFFAMVAHDVKNPLTAILGYAEILQSKLSDRPSELKSASHVYSAAKTLNVLISDLVDLAAIESGKLRVTLAPMDLAAVVADVRSRIEITAAQRKIIFGVEMPPALPALVGDASRIGQVIQNLCTNAIQYTKEGGRVTVIVQPGPDKVVVSVKDTGIGISKQDLPRVFEMFFQSE